MPLYMFFYGIRWEKVLSIVASQWLIYLQHLNTAAATVDADVAIGCFVLLLDNLIGADCVGFVLQGQRGGCGS